MHFLETVFEHGPYSGHFKQWNDALDGTVPISRTGFVLVPSQPVPGGTFTLYRNLDLLPFEFYHPEPQCPLKNYWCFEHKCRKSLTIKALSYLGFNTSDLKPNSDLTALVCQLQSLQSFIPNRWFRCPHALPQPAESASTAYHVPQPSFEVLQGHSMPLDSSY